MSYNAGKSSFIFIVPARCYTCGYTIGRLQREYEKLINEGLTQEEINDLFNPESNIKSHIRRDVLALHIEAENIDIGKPLPTEVALDILLGVDTENHMSRYCCRMNLLEPAIIPLGADEERLAQEERSIGHIDILDSSRLRAPVKITDIKSPSLAMTSLYRPIFAPPSNTSLPSMPITVTTKGNIPPNPKNIASNITSISKVPGLSPKGKIVPKQVIAKVPPKNILVAPPKDIFQPVDLKRATIAKQIEEELGPPPLKPSLGKIVPKVVGKPSPRILKPSSTG